MKLEEKVFESDDILFEEGDSGGEIFYIESGRIEVFKEREGNYIKLSVLGPGDILGTLSLIKSAKRTACAKATRKTICKVIPAEKIFENQNIPKWYLAILKDIVARFKDLEVKFLEMEVKKISKRRPIE